MVKFLIIIAFTLFNLSSAHAKNMSSEEESFLGSIFTGEIPKKKRLIVKGDKKEDIQKIMGDRYNKRIFSYWENDTEQVWILNSIGKYKPITAGFVINSCKIKSSHVIVYREAIGYEIKYPNFLIQLKDAEIKDNMKLNSKIDNISGATLSVNSMRRMARTALLLNKLSNEDTCT